jgi:uncharacterized protein YuzE
MKIRYDPKADAAYIYFREGRVQVTTIRITEDIAVDLGPGEEIVGVEVLSASEHLGLSGDIKDVVVETIG